MDSMPRRQPVILLLLLALLNPSDSRQSPEMATLFDFTSEGSSVDDWTELSDTTREQGLSKGSISIVEASTDRRAVFFSLLVPQPDSACFAGVQSPVIAAEQSDFSAYSDLVVNNACALGGHDGAPSLLFKAIVKDDNANSSLAFEHYFQVPTNQSVSDYTLALGDFVCSYRGQPCPDQPNWYTVRTVGFQIAGGVYESYSQQGVASLELDGVELA